MAVYEHLNYRTYLKCVLAERMERTPAYSMRALASHLGIARSYLTEILNGKKHPSLDVGLRIAHRLELSGLESDYFLLLIQLGSSNDPEVRDRIQKRLESLQPNAKIHDLSVDMFRAISDWYCFPILELSMIEGFSFKPHSVARKLGISVAEADVAIERLERLGLLEKTSQGRYRKAENYMLVAGKAHEEAIRKAHRGLLQKAIGAVETQGPAERKGRSDVLSIDPAQVKEAEAIMDHASRQIWELSAKSKRKTLVYAYTVQFFNLTPEKRR